MKFAETARRLSEALNDAGMNQQQLADASGIKKASISQYINGTHAPSNLSAGKMADILKVDAAWLCGFNVQKFNYKNMKPERHLIPIYGSVAAGIPIEAIEDIIDMEEISEEMARKGEYFGIRIKGDSMTPDIQDGDYVIVKRQSDAESNQIVIARINGDEGCCKKLVKYPQMISLMSLNPKYNPMNFTNDEIISKSVEIIGVVAEIRRKLLK